MKIPVTMHLTEEGKYVDLVVVGGNGVEFTLARIDKRLLNGPFFATVFDADDRLFRPVPPSEMSVSR